MMHYQDGALHIINLPLLTVVIVHNGVMVYRDYEGRHLWLGFPRWLSERICAQCGGIIWPWQQRAWWRSAFETYVNDRWVWIGAPLHERCIQGTMKP